ncbi:helix-turn-helix transcriptional regulator [Paenarthrobacter sp. Z7-10]|nr:helix-turn-helix transcriptional regulator [Paenarthrobacter sp. Z7-10]
MDGLQRVTAPTVDVLKVLVGTAEPVWGLRVIAESGRSPGTVYPVLERLEVVGWVASQWEVDESRPGPRRRYYELTADGALSAARTIAAFDARRAVHTAPRPAVAR